MTTIAIDMTAKTSKGVDRTAVRRSIERACEALFRKQRDDRAAFSGLHWCAELEGDSILSSEYILMKYILGQEGGEAERKLLPRLAKQLRLSQRADGSWGQYPGSPADVSACVKAYVCLKLMGDGVDAAHMQRARRVIREQGGAESINTFSMFYLACLGIVSWEACPVIPPQVVLLPEWFPFHIKKVAAWTRTMILPLALCSALQPVRKLAVDVDELFLDVKKKERLNKPWDTREVAGWNNVFLGLDRVLKVCRRLGFTPLRRRAVKAATAWVIQRMDGRTTEGLGAIFPPMVYVQIALQRLGYPREHPVLVQAERDLDAFIIDEPNADAKKDHARLQPCFSPVWDTAIAIDALTEAGVSAASDERLAASCDWLRAREVRLVGDWIENLRPEHRHLRPGVDVACWSFEYRNDWYPDVDDTCMVARALHKAGDRAGQYANRDAAVRAVQWLIAMQNDDGGWAAFDRTKDRGWMEAVPFADHNAMQDPSCSDITGRVTESLMVCGVSPEHPAVKAGVEYMLRTQQPEGCWWGRWGVNYIYGTWQAVNGLTAAGVSVDHPALVRAKRWLLAIQNADGGFGESANSYLDRGLMGKGPSTPSQTAWGLMTLMNLMGPRHECVQRAVAYLMREQLEKDKGAFEKQVSRRDVGAKEQEPEHEDERETEQAVQGGAVIEAKAPTFSAMRSNELMDVYGLNGETSRHAAENAAATEGAADPMTDHVRDLAGGWNEHWFTGTGFPKVFYLRYHLYRHSFPLKALARYERLMKV